MSRLSVAAIAHACRHVYEAARVRSPFGWALGRPRGARVHVHRDRSRAGLVDVLYWFSVNRTGRVKVELMKTAPLRFEFSRYDDYSEPAHGFDLGDMTISVGDAIHTSHGGTTRLAMMIYITLSGLLNGAAELLARERTSYELLAIDSSFSFTLSWAKTAIRVSANGRVLGTVVPLDLARELSRAVSSFLTGNDQLPRTDAVYGDLAQSIRRFQEVSSGVER